MPGTCIGVNFRQPWRTLAGLADMPCDPSHQFRHRVRVIKEALRTAVVVGQLLARVDAEDVVDRGQGVLEADRAALEEM